MVSVAQSDLEGAAALNSLKIASVQLDVVYKDSKACLAKVIQWIEKAASEKAELIVFPELVLSGGYELGEAFYDIAEPIPGPSTKAISTKAAELGVAVVAGIAELAPNDVLYNSAVFIEKSGRIAGVYRKSHPFPSTEHIFALGSELPVFDAGFGKLGIQICYDLEFPEPSRVLALKGAQIIVSPSAIMEEPMGPDLRIRGKHFIGTIYAARSLENRLPTVLSNRVGYDPDVKTSYAGLSRIVDSEGLTLVEAGREEQVITAVIDLDEERRKRQKYNYFRDRKPHLYEAIASRN